jgi:hypothetical protein
MLYYRKSEHKQKENILVTPLEVDEIFSERHGIQVVQKLHLESYSSGFGGTYLCVQPCTSLVYVQAHTFAKFLHDCTYQYIPVRTSVDTVSC